MKCDSKLFVITNLMWQKMIFDKVERWQHMKGDKTQILTIYEMWQKINSDKIWNVTKDEVRQNKITDKR